jgi:hypothetical protein
MTSRRTKERVSSRIITQSVRCLPKLLSCCRCTYWYWKITQQCSDISSFKSRQVVTKFSQGIPHHSPLLAACTACWLCIIVVIPVPITPICPILSLSPLSSGMAENTNLLADSQLAARAARKARITVLQRPSLRLQVWRCMSASSISSGNHHLEGCLMVYTTPKVVYTTLGIYHGIYKRGRWYITWYIP